MIKKIKDMTVSELREQCKFCVDKIKIEELDLDEQDAICQKCAIQNVCGILPDEITDDIANIEVNVKDDTYECIAYDSSNELTGVSTFCYDVQMIDPKIENLTINICKGDTKC